MPMKNPPHPGAVVLHACTKPLGLTRTFGVTRTTLSELENAAIGESRPKWQCVVRRYSGSAASWVTQQAHYDRPRSPPPAESALRRLAVA